MKSKVIIVIVFIIIFCAFIPNFSNAKSKNIISTKNINIVVNKKKQLRTKDYKKYVWSTSNKKIAKVTKKSIVTAKKEGKVQIIGVHKSTGKKRIYNVTVKPKVLESIKASVDSQKHWVGEKYKLKVKIQPADCKETIYWKSSNKDIAEVSGNYIKMKSSGRASITFFTKDYRIQSTIWVTAYDPPEIKFKENNPIRLETKNVKQLDLDCKDYPKSKIKYKSNHSEIIKVNKEGKITAVRPGSAIITATTPDR